jgi:soluble lytic murein transglycosylase
MRGITISRLSATRAVLAGALLAGASWHDSAAASADQAQTPEETALAMPRVKLPAGTGGLGLPQPLPPSEAARIKRILKLQRGGDIPAAIAETGRLTDDTLLGTILADRLLQHAGRSSAPALSAWLKRYADLPDANTVYALLLKKLPAGAARPAPPATAHAADSGADPRETDGPARQAFARGRDDTAYRIGRAAWRRSGLRDAQSAYIAGLAAWRRNDTPAAQAMFEAAADCPTAGSGLRAAAAFLAARAHAQNGDIPGWRPWMLRAAAEPLAFHGILARKALGIDLPAQPLSAELGQADLDSVAATPQGRRGFALLQVGENAGAAAEFRLLWRNNLADGALGRAIFLIARTAKLEDLQATLAGEVHFSDTATKLPSLRPNGGFTLDPALVYAVARVESNFDPHAGSANDAHGLMQVRPDVASFLTHGRVNLRDPGTNLKIGQRYLSYLSAQAIAGDDLLHVLAAYNAGPSALQRWKLDTEDPLLFIESLPIDETRRYVQTTLTFLWRYAARMKLPAPSLDALALNAWPKFTNEVARLH